MIMDLNHLNINELTFTYAYKCNIILLILQLDANLSFMHSSTCHIGMEFHLLILEVHLHYCLVLSFIKNTR